MTNEEKELGIDRLLVYLNNYIEQEGHIIQNVSFNLRNSTDDSSDFLEQHRYTFDDLKIIVNTCVAREYLKGFDDYSSLTESGQGRAISVINADKPSVSHNSNINIGTLNNHGSAQFGNNNTQNIKIAFQSIIEQIDNADATPEEKTEAKNRLMSFLSHPLVNTTLGTVANALITLAGAI